MKFAVNVPTSGGRSAYSNLAYCEEVGWADQREFATAAEELGFDGVAVPDHLITGGGGGTTECFTTLTGLAGVTDDVYLYPKTVNNELRNPALLAKTAATLDAVSGGRLKLGMGAGWKDDEARAYGYDWPDAPTRLRKLEEALELVDRLWTEDEVTYDGEFYSLDGAICKPHPAREPRPPFMVGGGGEEFTLRIAAKHADSWNYWGPLDLMERKLDVLESHCGTYGRDYGGIEKSWFARCIVRETDEGVEEVLADAPRFRPENLGDDEHHLVGTPEDVVADLERYRGIGIEEMVVEFVDFPRTDGASLFADRVIPEFD